MALHSLHHTLNNVIRPSFIICGLRCRLPSKVCAAFITSKELWDHTIEKPKPWPYETKKLTYLHSVFDVATKRFDENTKVIVVDGNIAAGKTMFAQKLADAFDMKYIPEPTMDRYYITPYGYDLRNIDEFMPPSYKACDVKIFYANPHHPNVPKFQYKMFMARCNDYIDALAHVLNTGQGVVMDRSVYSDFIFMEAMHAAGYVSRPVRDLYKDSFKKVLQQLLKPHLIVYLDVPVDIILERIKARNNPAEVNSKVLTKEYLSDLETLYKNDLLKNLSQFSEILVYDWSHYGDTEVVVEDIEQIDFDKYGRYDKKIRDWRREDHWEWAYLRRKYTSRKRELFVQTRIFRPSVTELYHPREDSIEYQELLDKIPSMRYEEGFNPELGENYLLKIRSNKVR